MRGAKILLTFELKNLDCDVLVMGGGLAGIMAALAAKETQSRIFLFMKGAIGSSGSSSYAGGGFAASVGDKDTPGLHAGDTLAGGYGLNDAKLVEVFCQKAPEAMMCLKQLGVSLGSADGRLSLLDVPGHSVKRGIRCLGGGTQKMMQVLRHHVIERKIKVFEDIPIIDLVVEQGRVLGAVGINTRNPCLYHIKTAAIVIASGGMGNLYPLTSNPGDLWGDGYVLGLLNGATLKDMEFIQFSPTALAHPSNLQGTSTGGMLLGEGALLTNRNGERFMERYDPARMEASTRDVVSRAIQREIVEGRGTKHGGVYLDLSTLTREFLEKNAGHFMALLAKNGIDPLTSLLEIAPAVHFCMGGIKINASCETGIDGMFAAGEVTAGVHGANRLSSNGLTEALVFGRIAGEQAGRRAVERSASQTDFFGWERYLESSNSAEFLTIEQIKTMVTQVRQCMLKAGGLERNRANLEDGIKRLKQLRKKIEQLRPKNPSTLVEYVRLRNMAILGLTILTSALVREESRGAHFRSDFPNRNDVKWLRNIELSWENGELTTNC